MTLRVGFAGTGLMGRGMARNILDAGFLLAVVAHRSRAPIEALVSQGATELHSYRNLAVGSDVVFLCDRARRLLRPRIQPRERRKGPALLQPHG